MKGPGFKRAFLRVSDDLARTALRDGDQCADDTLPVPHVLSDAQRVAVAAAASARLARALRHTADLLDQRAHLDVVCEAHEAAEAIARETLPWLRAARRST